jgi:AsmA protein
MTRFFAALLALIVLLVAILVLAPNLVPAGAYKGAIETEATKALGRQVTIGDKISFRIFPRVAFAVNDLTVSNAEGFEGPYLARVDRADIGVKLGPLLQRKIEISKFVLTRPDLNLQKARDGRVNWNLAAPAQGGAADSGPPAINEISFGDMRLVDGKAVYADAVAHKTYTIEEIKAEARLQSLAQPLEIAGEMKFQGAASTVTIVLANLADILAKRPANLKLDATIGGADIGADLALAGGDTFGYSGPVSLSAPDLPALATIFDVALQEAPGFDKLSVSGEATGAAASLALTGAKIAFDAINAEGDVKLDWAGSKPKATGSLSTDALDLRPYLPPPPPPGSTFPAWSTEKLDLASLRNIDADLDIRASKVFLNDIETGEARMRLRVLSGRMTADIPQLGFYGGTGAGRLVVDAAGRTPAIAGDFKMEAVDANPFTIDLMKMDKILGLGGFTFKFNAAGSSQKAIMESLDGNGGFDLNDGALKGVNIAKLATAVAKLYEGGLTNPTAISAAIAEAQRADEKTDFSKFRSEFSIVDGQMQAPTISLTGPYLSMTGVGKVNLPGQSMDIRLLPRASTSIDGTTGRMAAIPVKIDGTFAKPKLSIDVETMIRGRAEQSLRGLIDRALKPKAGEDGAAGAPAEEEDPSRTLLDGLFGRGKEPPPAEDGPTGAAATGTETAPAKDPAEAIASEALGRLFGRPKAEKPAPEETAGDKPN